MSLESIRKKINIKTFMGQSEALVENTETLKSNVKRLFTILTKKKKISPETLLEKKKTEEVKKISVEKEKEDKKKGGLKLPPFLPLLAGLGGLAAAFAISPKVFSKRLLKSTLKAIGKLIKGILKTFKKIVSTIGNIFKKIFNAIADNAKKLKNLIDDKLLKPIREAFENAINSKWFKKLRSFFDDIGTSVKNFIKNSAERFKTFADDIFKKIKTTFNDLVDRGIKAFKGILDEIAEKILKPLKESLLEFVDRTKKLVANAGQTVITEVTERIVKPVQENIIQPLIKQVTEGVTNIIDGLEKNILGVVDKIPPIPTSVGGEIGKLKVELPVPFAKEANAGIDALRNNLKGVISNISGSIKSLVQDPVSSIRRVMTLGGEKLTQLQDFGKGVSEQFKTSLLDPIINGAKQIGQSAADIGRGFASNVGERVQQAQDLAKKLDPMRVVKEIPGRISEIAGNIINPVRNAVVTPLTDIVSGGARGLGNALVSIGGGLGKAGDALGAVRGGLNSMVSFFDKIPLPKGVKQAFKESTGRFDRYFAIAESAASYALAVKRKNTGESTDIGPFKDLKGQMLGNAILTAAGGFLGSAIGATAGSLIPIPFAGFIGTVIGGMIGEEFGKFAAAKVAGMMESNGIPNEDPFLSTETEKLPIFNPNETNLIGMIESDGPAGIAKFFGFGGEQQETPDLAPQGGFNAGPVPRSVPMNRDFETLEEYSEIYEADLVIVKQTEIVNRVQKPVTNNSSSNLIILSDSIDSVLNNFRDRSLTQLSYS